MARTHVIPGAVTRTTLKALVLSDGPAPPLISVVPERAAVPMPAVDDADPLVPAPELVPHLRGVRLSVVRIRALVPGEGYHLMWPGGASRFVTPGEGSPLELVVASCYFDGFRGAQKYRSALGKAPAKDATLKLLVGDNLYLDVYGRSFHDPWRDVADLYLHHFWDSPYSDVLAQLPTLTTWDDHEFWNNFPETAFWLGHTQDARREPTIRAARECLRLFQASLNPDPGPGVVDLSYQVADLPYVDLFVADTRADRQRDTGGHDRMMPDPALVRLEHWAARLTRPGILVIGQPLWMEEGSGVIDLNPPRFRDQYFRIWRALADAPWDVLIVSGDVHHSRLLILELDGGRRVYEYVSSPVSHIPSVLGGGQGIGDVGFVTRAPFSLVPGDPRLARDPYIFGTDAPSTIGTLSFHPLGSGAVTADAAFLDLDDGARPAASRWANDGFLQPGVAPQERRRCRRARAITLRQRI